MTKIIPIGMRGKKIIPVGTKRECTRSVLASGSTGQINIVEKASCEVVLFQVSSGVEVHGQQNKNARVEVSEEWELFEKNIPRAASCS